MPFLTEPEPVREAATEVAPGIRRVVARNPGVMTYHGTNTYLIDTPDGLVVLDPGPDDRAHVGHILAACADRPVALILVSHTHADHVGAVPALKAATGARTAGFAASAIDAFTPDIPLEDGATVAGMTALHTPGHASDHLCFARPGEAGARVLFSADHVMSWSSSVVSPPGGDMADYFASLRRLLAREEDDLYLPGHGPPLPEPRVLVAELLHHREERERAIATALASGARDPQALVDELYSQTHPALRRAAERNVIAHLLKLEREGRVTRRGQLWRRVVDETEEQETGEPTGEEAEESA
jgi:glyoxylase-like metal-dependent hydrolase (beta-lactamase superfamily II)